VFAGDEGGTTSTIGTTPTRLIGAKLFRAS
jgi:hypothetical protein